MPDAPIKLSRRERRYVTEYLVDLNGSEAVRRMQPDSKRPDVIAAKLHGRPQVKAAILEAMAKREERTGITQDYVLEVIRETVERCKQGEIVRDKLGRPVVAFTKDGSLAAVYRFDAKAVLAGASLLMDHLGMKRTRLEHSGPNGTPLEPPVFNFGFKNGGPGNKPDPGTEGS
jgi:phage terminase small subunit